MAPVNSVQADWLDVEDFGYVGVNNCNLETCTDTRTAEVNTVQAVFDNNNTSTGSSTTNFNPIAPCTCAAGEVEEEPVIIPQ